jgi:hypothetical protein
MKVASLAHSVPFQHVMGNLSYLVGWTIAGSAVNDDQLDATCNDINGTSHGKWALEGLNETYIQEPICNATHSSPNTTTAVPWVLYYSTELFVTQLLHAFAPDNKNATTYLCENLDFDLIDNFRLRSARVVNATCTAAKADLPPRPAAALPASEQNLTAPVDFISTISTLYGLVLASAATSDTQLNIQCAHAPDYVKSLDSLVC